MAGDLSSHIYNAWLATLIEQGSAPGLVIRPMVTNFGFDVVLESLLKACGPDLAQRIAASAVVLVFAGGLFAFLCAASRRRPWFLLPYVAALSYGWVFRMGFLNFLLSTGLCLMAMALVLHRLTWLRAVFALALATAAFACHSYPVLWSFGIIAYYALSARIRPRFRPLLMISSIVAVVIVRQILTVKFICMWAPAQQASFTGADQLWTGGWSTFFFVPAVFLLWTILLARLLDRISWIRVALAAPIQLLVINAFGTLALPTGIFDNPRECGFMFIAERTSLLVAASVLLLLARARPHRAEAIGGFALAVVFFGVAYAADLRLNKIEDQVDAAVARLAPGVRVTAPIQNSGRINQALHMIDRACVGRCFSYANYEAPSGKFRIRVAGDSPLVAKDYPMSVALQIGEYRPTKNDRAFYVIRWCPGGNGLCTAELLPN